MMNFISINFNFIFIYTIAIVYILSIISRKLIFLIPNYFYFLTSFLYFIFSISSFIITAGFSGLLTKKSIYISYFNVLYFILIVGATFSILSYIMKQFVVNENKSINFKKNYFSIFNKILNNNSSNVINKNSNQKFVIDPIFNDKKGDNIVVNSSNNLNKAININDSKLKNIQSFIDDNDIIYIEKNTIKALTKESVVQNVVNNNVFCEDLYQKNRIDSLKKFYYNSEYNEDIDILTDNFNYQNNNNVDCNNVKKSVFNEFKNDIITENISDNTKNSIINLKYELDTLSDIVNNSLKIKDNQAVQESYELHFIKKNDFNDRMKIVENDINIIKNNLELFIDKMTSLFKLLTTILTKQSTSMSL